MFYPIFFITDSAKVQFKLTLRTNREYCFLESKLDKLICRGSQKNGWCDCHGSKEHIFDLQVPVTHYGWDNSPLCALREICRKHFMSQAIMLTGESKTER